MPDRPVVAVCAGKDCARDQRKQFRLLVDALDGLPGGIVKTKCMGLCNGPVAVVGPCSESPVVVRRIRKRPGRDAFLRLVTDPEATGSTGLDLVRKPKKRAKAIAVARRAGASRR